MLDQSFHRFGEFIIVRMIGRGGMGEVFVARTPWDADPVAVVKRLRPDVARVPTFAERFNHEAELAVRLEHPNVVSTLHVGSVGEQLYVCSELILGKDTGFIADRLRERGQGGPAAVAIRLLIDTLSGLSYVHHFSEPDGRLLMLVHRDVTPGNVLVGYDGIVRIADFGLAKSLLTEGHQLTAHGEILGTPHYLAPELIRGDDASPASDIYGLGAVMYRFLTGVAPHTGTTAEVLLKVLTEEPPPLLDRRPDLPPWLAAFVERMMTKDPSRRPHDAGALAKQLGLEARAAGLVVPRASVGRWLGTLFEVERADELEERDRVATLDPSSVPERPEGTVVLASVRPGSRVARELPDAMEPDSHGTALDLSEGELQELADRWPPRGPDTDPAPAAGERRASGGETTPPERPLLGAGATGPLPEQAEAEARRPVLPAVAAYDLQPSGQGEVTEAAQRVDLPTIAQAAFADESFEGMPTRAVQVPRGFSAELRGEAPGRSGPKITERSNVRRVKDPSSDPKERRPEISGADWVPRDDETMGPGVLARDVPTGSGDTRLPGFVDDGPKRAPSRHEGAASAPPSSAGPSVAASAGPSAPGAGGSSAGAAVGGATLIAAPSALARPVIKAVPSRLVIPPSETEQLPAPAAPSPREARERGRTDGPADRLAPVVPPGRDAPTDARARAASSEDSVLRNISVLILLLFLAIVLGIGIGFVVSTLKKPQPIVVEAPSLQVRERFLRLKNELDQRKARGEVVEAHAWELVASAGTAIAEGNEPAAERALDEVERFLARPR